MKRLTSAGLFVSPKTARKANIRVEHAKSVVASAREHAAKTAQRYEEEWRKKKWMKTRTHRDPPLNGTTGRERAIGTEMSAGCK